MTVQHLEQSLRVTDPQTDFGAQAKIDTPVEVAATDIAGGIHRDEEAELLGFQVHNHRGNPDQDNVPANYQVRFGMWLGYDTGERGWLAADDEEFSITLEDDAGNTAGEIARQREEDDPGILWFDKIHLVASHVTDGRRREFVKAGPWPYFDFIERFGGGPVLQDTDEIVFSGTFNLVDYASDINLVQLVNFSLYWDVRPSSR